MKYELLQAWLALPGIEPGTVLDEETLAQARRPAGRRGEVGIDIASGIRRGLLRLIVDAYPDEPLVPPPVGAKAAPVKQPPPPVDVKPPALPPAEVKAVHPPASVEPFAQPLVDVKAAIAQPPRAPPPAIIQAKKPMGRPKNRPQPNPKSLPPSPAPKPGVVVADDED